MSELKPCPFCGLEPISYGEDSCTECPYCHLLDTDDWNTRPIEDALTKRIEELERFASHVSDLLHDSFDGVKGHLRELAEEVLEPKEQA